MTLIAIQARQFTQRSAGLATGNCGLICTLICCCLAQSLSASEAQSYPYGHAEFYPSADKPLGFLADGRAHYPAANPPVDFNSETGQAIAWQTPVPAGMAQPLQIGEKIIVSCAPWTIRCLNAHDGSQVWERSFPPWRDMPATLAASCQEEWTYFRTMQERYASFRELGLSLEKQMYAAKLNPRKLALFPTQGNPKPIPIKDESFQQDLLKARAMAKEHGFVLHNFGNDDMVNRNVWSDWSLRVARLYNLYSWSRWWGFTTTAYITPVTDGEHIYLPSVMNQIVCMDLYGNIKWTRWLPSDSTLSSSNLGTRFVKSPLLHGDYLIWRSDSQLTVLNKRTGKQIWRRGIHGTTPSLGQARPAPECTPPALMSLSADCTVVLDPLGEIFKLSTGAKMGKIPPQNLKWQSRPVVFGDIVVQMVDERSKDKKMKPYAAAYRLTLADDKKTVTSQELWRKGNWAGFRYGDLVLIATDKKQGHLLDPQSGEQKGTARFTVMEYGWPVIAGDKLFSWTSRGKKGIPGGFTITGVNTDFRSKTDAVFLRDQRLENDETFRARWAHMGSTKFISSSTHSFQGKRMYVRTIGTVWALGEKTLPTSATWPAQGLVASKPSNNTSQATALEALLHPLAQIRQSALTQVADLPIAQLIDAYAQSEGAVRCDIIKALELLGPKAAPAAASLAKDLAGKDNGLSVHAAFALAAIGSEAKTHVAPLLEQLTSMASVTYQRDGDQNIRPAYHRIRAMALALSACGVDISAARKAAGRNAFLFDDAKAILAGTHTDARPVEVK